MTKLKNKVVETFQCNCPHEYQDSLYGKGERIHNPTSGKDSTVRRCTVCGRAKTK